MADVMDMPPEPLHRDAERRKGGVEDGANSNRRRGEEDSRSNRHGKRRKSISPHRDRRQSPSRRSPTGKRYRRDDDRFDARDGILGRGSYDHGRHRQNDWSGRGGYGDQLGGYQRRDGLKTYKQFVQELEDEDIGPEEAEQRYQEYKAVFTATQKKAFFEQHKDEDWLREKYDPSRLEPVLTKRNDNAKSCARDFHLDLQAGTLDMVSGRSSLEAAADGNKGRGKDDGAPRAPYASRETKRVAKDIEQAQALIKKLDTEKGISANMLASPEQQLTSETGGPIVIVRGANEVKGFEGLELLDAMLTYLWRVHGLDYYGMIELRECPKGFRHVRSEGKESKTGEEKERTEWEKKLDSTWQARLQGQDPLEAMLGKEKLEATASDALESYVRKIRDEKYGWKYGCLATGCSKLFHGPEFVHKHLKLKHPEIVTEAMATVLKDLYFKNYMSDPNAPGVASVQPAQRDNRSLKRRGLPERLGPPVGNGRGRGGEDMDNYDGAGPSASEQPMFDPFVGPGIPAFGSEIPPPVLMPVPGAGPLGPFVPAPPDVTMRMWRGEQPFHAAAPYDAAPYDGGERGGGRKGRGALDGTQLVPPPGVRHDPRSMRSYHDLDAPEDEVMVIDYRSI